MRHKYFYTKYRNLQCVIDIFVLTRYMLLIVSKGWNADLHEDFCKQALHTRNDKNIRELNMCMLKIDVNAQGLEIIN